MTVYIQFNHNITTESVNALTDALGQISNQNQQGQIDLDGLYIMFNSSGGQVDAGISLYNFLDGLSHQVTIHNVGSVDSVATVIFLAGDDKYAAPGSSFLFHGVAARFRRDDNLSLPRLKERLSSLEQDQDKVTNLITSNCDLTEPEVENLNQQGQSKGVQWALNKSIIDRVTPLNIPTGAQIITIN